MKLKEGIWQGEFSGKTFQYHSFFFDGRRNGHRSLAAAVQEAIKPAITVLPSRTVSTAHLLLPREFFE